MDNHDIYFNELDGAGGAIGEILLNRTESLNALSLTMCDAIFKQLTKWATDKRIKAVIIKSNSDKAFCAGGDIRNLYNNGEMNCKENVAFFQYEYRMNAALQRFPKPYIALLDGITMGGGCGISLHGSHRVATEKLTLAMPETMIGFYPDIGAAHFLLKCPGKTGLYLALSSARVDAATALELGLVTHTVPRQRLVELEHALLNTVFAHDDFVTVGQVIDQFAGVLGESSLAPVQPVIDECFAAADVETILTNLKTNGHSFANTTLDTLIKCSPTSLKVTFARMQRAKSMKFSTIINTDYQLSQHFLQAHDFVEGVRAAVIDKDRNPQWQPATLEQVNTDRVNQFFVPLGEALQL